MIADVCLCATSFSPHPRHPHPQKYGYLNAHDARALPQQVLAREEAAHPLLHDDGGAPLLPPLLGAEVAAAAARAPLEVATARV